MNILPCPFCGDVDIADKPEIGPIRNQRGKETGFYCVTCQNCGCSPNIGATSVRQALAFWNARAKFSGTQEAHTGFEIARKTMMLILEDLKAPMR